MKTVQISYRANKEKGESENVEVGEDPRGFQMMATPLQWESSTFQLVWDGIQPNGVGQNYNQIPFASHWLFPVIHELTLSHFVKEKEFFHEGELGEEMDDLPCVLAPSPYHDEISHLLSLSELLDV